MRAVLTETYMYMYTYLMVSVTDYMYCVFSALAIEQDQLECW